MKYEYDGTNPAETIGNYRVKGNKIIVTYLDGHEDDNFENNKQTHKDLLEQMNSQAKETLKATENITFQQLVQQEIESLTKVPHIAARTTALSFCNSYQVSILFALFKSTLKLRCLEKYRYYAEIQDKLDQLYLQDPTRCWMLLNNGYKTKHDWLDWNTIDDYSLHEIKRIRRQCQK